MPGTCRSSRHTPYAKQRLAPCASAFLSFRIPGTSLSFSFLRNFFYSGETWFTDFINTHRFRPAEECQMLSSECRMHRAHRSAPTVGRELAPATTRRNENLLQRHRTPVPIRRGRVPRPKTSRNKHPRRWHPGQHISYVILSTRNDAKRHGVRRRIRLPLRDFSAPQKGETDPSTRSTPHSGVPLAQDDTLCGKTRASSHRLSS